MPKSPSRPHASPTPPARAAAAEPGGWAGPTPPDGGPPPIASAAWGNIDGLVMDCDGVLTAGGLIYDPGGGRQLVFDAKDGFGLALACRRGLRAAVLSGRPTDIAEARLRELGVSAFLGGCRDKAAGMAEICARLEVAPSRCAFIGDDLPDLPAFGVAGLAVAVADASREALAQADVICSRPGGHGAVREVCEAWLQARGIWQAVVAELSSPERLSRGG